MTDSALFNPLRKDSVTKSDWVLLAVFTVLGAALRMYKLDFQSFWLDELTSWWTAQHDSVFEVVRRGIREHPHPPGYHIVLHYFVRVFGDSESSLRSLSVLTGILSVPAMFTLSLRLYSLKEARLASGLIAFMVLPVYLSQEARMYSGLLLLSILTTLSWTYLVDALRMEGVRVAKTAIGYFALACVTAYWHYFGLFMVGLQGLILFAVLIRRPRAVARAIGLYLLVAISYLPWIPSMLTHLRTPNDAHPFPASPLQIAFRDYLASLYSYKSPDLTGARICASVTMVLFAGMCVFGMYSLYKNDRSRAKRDAVAIRGGFLAAWLLAPFLFAYMASISGSSIYTIKNLIVSFPVVLLLLAHGIVGLASRPKVQLACALALPIAALFQLTVVSSFYKVPFRTQFREAAAVVVANEALTPNSLIVCAGYSPHYFDYYLSHAGSDRKVDLLASKEGDIPAFEEAVRAKRPEHIWYLSAAPYPDKPFLEYLTKNFEALGTQTFLRTEVLILQPKPGFFGKPES